MPYNPMYDKQRRKIERVTVVREAEDTSDAIDANVSEANEFGSVNEFGSENEFITEEESMQEDVSKEEDKFMQKMPSYSGRKSISDVEYKYLRNIPSSLIKEVQRMFPGSSQGDAVAAFLALRLGVTDGLTDRQLLLLKEYTEEDPLISVQERLRLIEKKLLVQEKRSEELELAISYLIFDRLGYRKEIPASPVRINFLENGVEDVRNAIRLCASQLYRQDKISEGRPRKGASSDKYRKKESDISG